MGVGIFYRAPSVPATHNLPLSHLWTHLSSATPPNTIYLWSLYAEHLLFAVLQNLIFLVLVCRASVAYSASGPDLPLCSRLQGISIVCSVSEHDHLFSSVDPYYVLSAVPQNIIFFCSHLWNVSCLQCLGT